MTGNRRRRLRELARRITAAVVAAALALPGAAPALGPATAYAATGQTIDQALGCTRSIVEVLESHLNDGYYLGTPYGNTAPMEYGDTSAGTMAKWDSWYPNGNPKPGVGGYMNCAGFIAAVIREAGGDTSPVASHVASSGYNKGNEANGSKWKWYAMDNGLMTAQFNTKQEMLASGILEKGDIIYIQPTSFTGLNDCHIMFFWGDSPSQDLAWHSTIHGDGVIAGSADHGNMISQITPKGSAAYYQVYKVQHSVDVNFTKVSADATVTDGNSEYAYSGATYDIYRASDNLKVATITTDESGHASYKLQPNTAYYAVETKAPQGFKVNPNRIDFNTGTGSNTIDLADDPGTVIFRVIKKDSATGGEPQSGLTLAGAEYKIVDANGKEHVVTTDERGIAMQSGLPFGKTTIVETKAPEGYELDTTVHTYTVNASQMTDAGVFELTPEDDFAENPVAFDIEIAKFKGENGTWDEGDGHENPAAGVEFQIISNTTGKPIGTITTGEDGFAETDGLWFGEGERGEGIDGAVPYDPAGYTVREVASTVPDGFDHVDDWTISADEMASGAKLRYICNDQQLDSLLRIVKQDSETGLQVPLKGFSFQILDEDGNPVSLHDNYPSDTTIDTFTTDETGTVTLPERLLPGTYTVHETAAQAPYLLGEDVEFTVSSDHEEADALTVVTVTDEQAMGRATVTKTCAEGELEGEHVHDEGCTGALAGAEFDVVAMQDVVSPDGTVRAVEGEVVDHVVTGDDGKATTKDLYLGTGSATYAFVETAPPAGHVLDETPHEFTLAYADAETPLVEVGVEVANAPTEIVLDKTVMGEADPLPGAVFEFWNAEDEAVLPDETDVAIQMQGDVAPVLTPAISGCTVSASIPDGMSAVLVSDDGSETKLDGTVELPAGEYAIEVRDTDGTAIEFDGDDSVELTDGKAYELTVADSFFTGVSATIAEIDPASTEISLEDAGDGIYVATGIAAGEYLVTVDGSEAGTIAFDGESTVYAAVVDGNLTSAPILLAGGAETGMAITGQDGRIVLRHMGAGSYRIVETEAPAGFVRDQEVRFFTVTEDGKTEGEPSHSIHIEDDYTKVDISKRDITNEDEIPGATLTVLDSEGNVVDTWVSTEEDHRIEALAPGDYTLVEEMTPHTYDEATAVEFTVEETGEVQRVVMYDEPIEVTGEIDKRQEIADPVAEGTLPNGDNRNTAEVSTSEDGSYEYSVDFRSTSSTWVDEFTVTDDLSAVGDGLAELEAIVTPQAFQDYDGKLNVWYRTDQTPEDYTDPSSANATLSDGHENPWLSHESTAEALGDDARAIDYSGWRLWASDVSATEATRLSVADLGLAADEHVTAVRLEYGRVEIGFTSRLGDWNRENIKDPHDDLDDVAATHAGEAIEGTETHEFNIDGEWLSDSELAEQGLSASQSESGSWLIVAEGGDEAEDGAGATILEEGSVRQVTAEYAPLVVCMKVTDAYRDGTVLRNDAVVDLYRNGGNTDDSERLEDHDSDSVEQTVKAVVTPVEELAQTGAPILLAAGACAALAAATAGAVAIRRRMASAADEPSDDDGSLSRLFPDVDTGDEVER